MVMSELRGVEDMVAHDPMGPSGSRPPRVTSGRSESRMMVGSSCEPTGPPGGGEACAMSEPRQQRIDEISGQAKRLAPADRAAFLKSVCGDDAELARQVQARLDGDRRDLQQTASGHLADSPTPAAIGRTTRSRARSHRSLPDHPPYWRRWHGRRLRSGAGAASPDRRPQGDSSRSGLGDGTAPLRIRSRGARPAAPSRHCADLRGGHVRHGRRTTALLRHGADRRSPHCRVRDREQPRRATAAAAARSRGRCRAACAPAGGDPSRSEAGQHPRGR